jgi:hypothetical protein
LPLNLIKVPRNSQFAQHALQFRLVYAVSRGTANLNGYDVGAKNVATFRLSTNVSVSLCSENGGGRGNICAEQAIYAEVQQDLIAGATINWVFTEYEPCGLQLHNCRGNLLQWLTAHGTNGEATPVYYLMPYPDDDLTSKKKSIKVNKSDGEIIFKNQTLTNLLFKSDKMTVK